MVSKLRKSSAGKTQIFSQTKLFCIHQIFDSLNRVKKYPKWVGTIKNTTAKFFCPASLTGIALSMVSDILTQTRGEIHRAWCGKAQSKVHSACAFVLGYVPPVFILDLNQHHEKVTLWHDLKRCFYYQCKPKLTSKCLFLKFYYSIHSFSNYLLI